jgi:hexokinase
MKRLLTNQGHSTTGSLAQIHADMAAQVKRLEELFTVSTEKLKEITEYFVSELERGLSAKDGEGDHIVRVKRLTRPLY